MLILKKHFLSHAIHWPEKISLVYKVKKKIGQPVRAKNIKNKLFIPPWNPVRQLEADEEFFGIILSALHTFNLRIFAHL
ncbi:hypothetical protein ACVWYG_002344 [Pedobacter sp. UYEF25]